MFSNLRAEMARKGLKNKDLCDSLGVSEKTVRNYLDGKTKIAWLDVIKIQKTLFPDCEIGYLFNMNDETQTKHAS